MPIYRDDQCEECGAARVSGSRLCAGCMAKRLHAERVENLIKKQVIEGLRRKNKKLTRLCERLLDHITSQVMYAAELDGYKGRLERKLREVMADEKSRVHSDK